MQAAVGDIHVPLMIESRFVVGSNIGPPASKYGINKFAPSYLIKFKENKLSRGISFTEDGHFIKFENYYLDDKLSSFQIIELKNYISYRTYAAFKESWGKDLKAELGKAAKDAEGGIVQIDIPWEPPKIVQGIIGEGKSNIRVLGMLQTMLSCFYHS